jgi:hypothetical protein
VPQASGEFFIGHLNTCDMAEATRLRPMAGAAFNQAVVALERTVTIQPRKSDEADAFALIAKRLVEERPFWNIVTQRFQRSGGAGQTLAGMGGDYQAYVLYCTGASPW